MTKSSQNLRYIISLILVWSLISLLFTTISYLGAISERENISFLAIAGSNFTRYGLWGVLFHFIFKLTQKFDFQSGLHYFRNVFIQIILGVLFSTVHFIGYTIISWLISAPFRERYPNLWLYLQNSYPGSLYLGLMIYALIVLASQAYLRNKNLAEEGKKTALLQSQLIQAQLQALKMQLQPHFLFNTLNSISSLVSKNPLQAQTMIAKLGDFLRMTLDFNENQMVLLHEELRFLRSYLEIEQTRFSEKLQVKFNIDEDVMNAILPHLALQPIVENSVKHGISQMTDGGRIEIIAQKSQDKLLLQVKDNGPLQPTIPLETAKGKTGLSNIKTRLKHLYADNFSFDMKSDSGTGMIVTIIIPLNFDFAVTEKNDE